MSSSLSHRAIAEGAEAALRRQDAYRASCLNLIASENVISPAVQRGLQSDLEGRYADFTGSDLAGRKYRGGGEIVGIEERCAELACRVFGAQAAELRAISGHVAGNAVLMALCAPGDLVLEVGQDGGGHRLAAKLAEAPLIDLRVEFLPFDATAFNVDVEAATAMIAERHPRCVVLGSSTFLHPHPVAAIADACAAAGATLIYDGSHVMGLLAAGRFQRPLDEGAEVLFGSTHKTLFGPQGGLILGGSAIVERVAAALYPPLVTNHHPFRIPALTVGLAEQAEFGAAYADAVIGNAQAFQAALEEHGLETAGGVTESHAVLLVARDRPGAEAAARLEAQGLITNPSRLPTQLGGEGVRFGVQELTRRGGEPADAVRVAALVAGALGGREVRDAVATVAARLNRVHYTWTDR